MDRGAQGRVERCFLHANSSGILLLYARTVTWPVLDGGTRGRARSDVQTNAGYSAIRSFIARLLAAQED